MYRDKKKNKNKNNLTASWRYRYSPRDVTLNHVCFYESAKRSNTQESRFCNSTSHGHSYIVIIIFNFTIVYFDLEIDFFALIDCQMYFSILRKYRIVSIKHILIYTIFKRFYRISKTRIEFNNYFAK